MEAINKHLLSTIRPIVAIMAWGTHSCKRKTIHLFHLLVIYVKLPFKLTQPSTYCRELAIQIASKSDESQTHRQNPSTRRARWSACHCNALSNIVRRVVLMMPIAWIYKQCKHLGTMCNLWKLISNISHQTARAQNLRRACNMFMKFLIPERYLLKCRKRAQILVQVFNKWEFALDIFHRFS